MATYDLNTLLKTMIEQGASDLHITVGAPPAFRINGQIVRSKTEGLNSEDTKRICLGILNEQQRKKFDEDKELDFSFGVKGVARLRANLFVQRGSVAGVFRKIESSIRPLSEFGFNRHILGLLERPHGLVLVTGATGSGKSTTLASFINRINEQKRYHIVTIEDPIEYTHAHKTSLVNQREIGPDCSSFSLALRQVLREDPDVIMVGEMRDRETAEAALMAAETGHLVFSTLHTNGAIQTINRIVQMFPIDKQDYIRTLVSFSLVGILSQALCERVDQPTGKSKRVLAYEFLQTTPAIKTMIRENKLHQMYGQMQLAQDSFGMITMNQMLHQHVMNGIISDREAFAHSPDDEELQRLFDRGSSRKAV
jgi:twitching motility protein PilT